MGKEVKIGLSVIAVLLCIFGGVLYTRLRGDGDTTAAEATDSSSKDSTQREKHLAKDSKDKKPKPKLSGGPAPTSRLADGRRGDRYGSSSRNRANRNEVDNGVSNTVGASDADKQLDVSDAPSARASSRYGNRNGDRYGASADSATAEPDDAAGAGDGDAMATDAAGDETGDDDPGAADREIDERRSEIRSPNRFDSPNARARRGPAVASSRRSSEDDDDEGAEPPNELELDEAEKRLAHENEDPVIATVDGRLRGRPRQDDGDAFDSAPDRAAGELDGDDGVAPLDAAGALDAADAAEIEGEEYKVRPNDNYWTISQRVYGTGAYFKALQEFNRDRYPKGDRLDVGDLVSVPALDELERAYPKLCPKRRHVAAQQRTTLATRSKSAAGSKSGTGRRSYTVAEGDTLFDIARRELGSAERWAEIHELNSEQLGDDIHYLVPGTKLLLPGSGVDERPQERTATRSRNGLRR